MDERTLDAVLGHTPSPTLRLLVDLVTRRIGSRDRAWLEGALAIQPADLAECFTVAARRVGKRALDLTSDEVAAIEALGVTSPLGGWGLDELARVTLLVSAGGRLSPSELEELVEGCYRGGDNRERQAVLRALPLLPNSDRLLAVGVEACRTSVEPIFEAIACENPYPAAHFPDLNFNQLVLKALFIGVALDRIVGLDERRTPELARMAADYASERRAAGRPVPADIGRVLT